MSHPAAYIVTGVVIAVAAVIAFFVSKADEKNKPQAYGSRRGSSPPKRRPSPPPSPPPSSMRQRRQPTERHVNSPSHGSTSADSQSKTCTDCGESPFVKVQPCNHKSLCKGCVSKYLETNDTCKVCSGRIDSISPPIPSFGKCTSCRKFTKLLKFLPCNHSLSICVSCFESQNKSYKRCPECDQPIRDYEPKYITSGLCIVCGEFTRFAKFQPCSHGSFCMEHARVFLQSEEECNYCGTRVTEVV